MLDMLDQTMIYRKYFDIAMICILLSVNVPSIYSISCENMVRLPDVQDIIKNQTKLMQEQRQIIENQAKLNSELMTTVETLKTGKMEYLLVEVFVHLSNTLLP